MGFYEGIQRKKKCSKFQMNRICLVCLDYKCNDTRTDKIIMGSANNVHKYCEGSHKRSLRLLVFQNDYIGKYQNIQPITFHTSSYNYKPHIKKNFISV